MNFRCHRGFGWGVMLIALLFVHLEVLASGYHPPFNRALEEAELVIQGDVVEMWNPFDEGGRNAFGGQRCYRFKVQHCYKGGLKPGAEVLFWDRHFSSTASYGIRSKGHYILYLCPAKLSDYEVKHVNPDGRPFYRPIRGRSNQESYSGSRSVANYERELRLLDLFLENPPTDKRAAYRQLLENESDVQLLSYVVRDWPRPCTDEDILLFKNKVLASEETGAVERRMLGEVLKQSEVLSDADVIALCQKGGEEYFSSLSPLIKERKIEELRESLFVFIQDVGPGGPYRQLIETLAALDPDYFREQFRVTHDFPVWKLLPCLEELGLNGRDLGMPDFPEEVFTVGHNRLLEISKILEGDLFWISFPLRYPSNCEGMREALPLLEPVLRQKDSPVRRACVALFRTYGVPVKRSNGIYVPHYEDAPAPCPVKLELQMDRTKYTLGEEVEFVLKETAGIDGGDFCFEGKPLTVLYLEGGWHSPEFLNQKLWDDVALSPDQFTTLEKGLSREHKLKLFRKIDRPGTYRITLKKCYLHDGGDIGLDAWTGVAFAENELVFTVTEP